MLERLGPRLLAPLTTWRVGGPAAHFAEPSSLEEIGDLVESAVAAGVPWTILGRGSNLLVPDAGYPGLVIRLVEGFNGIRVEGDRVRAQAGASTAAVVTAAMEAGLGGLSFLAGIPGSVGGAVFMNAGAHGISTSDVLARACILHLSRVGLADAMPAGTSVLSVESMQSRARLDWFSPAQLDMRYRHSSLQDGGGVVVEAEFRAIPAPRDLVRQEILEAGRWRRLRQPQEPSAGSVFRNPPGDSAGRLIEACGLKGLTVGGAQVSRVHANFIVNLGGATAKDIQDLMQQVRERVYQAEAIDLVPEVRVLWCGEPASV